MKAYTLTAEKPKTIGLIKSNISDQSRRQEVSSGSPGPNWLDSKEQIGKVYLDISVKPPRQNIVFLYLVLPGRIGGGGC